MKTRLWLVVLWAVGTLAALGQQPVPPAASPAEVAAGTDRYKYVTPYAAATSGISSNGITAAGATNIIEAMRQADVFDIGGNAATVTSVAGNAAQIAAIMATNGSSQLTAEQTQPLILPTYDGFQHATHPSVVDAGTNGFAGHRYWLGYTPYPWTPDSPDSSRENPSIAYSDDLKTWRLPPRAPNPLFTWQESLSVRSSNVWSYWSDSEIIIIGGTNLVMVGRWAEAPSLEADRYYIKTSTNGSDWSALRGVYTNAVGVSGIVSPQLTDTGTNLIWWFGQDNLLKWMESDYAMTTFSAIKASDLAVWHMDVKPVGTNFWCIFQQWQGGQYPTYSPSNLFFATSNNRTNWTWASTNVVRRSGYDWDTEGYYKPDFLVNDAATTNITLIAASATVGVVTNAANNYYFPHQRIGLWENITIPWTNLMTSITNRGVARSEPGPNNRQITPVDNLVAETVKSSGFIESLRGFKLNGVVLPPFLGTVGDITVTNQVVYPRTSVVPSGTNVALPMTNGELVTVICPTVSNFVLTNALTSASSGQMKRFILDSGGSEISCYWPTDWTWCSLTTNTVSGPTNIAPNQALLLELWSVAESKIARVSYITSSFDTNALAFISAAGITNLVQKTAINNLVKGLKAADTWTNYVAIYPFVGGTSNSHAQNLISTNYPIVWAGGVTHDANGTTGNGVDGWGDTGLSPTAVFANTSVRHFVYAKNQAGTNSTYYFGAGGAASSNNRWYARREGTNVMGQAIGDNLIVAATFSSGVGYMGQRIGASSMELRNGYVYTTSANAETALPDRTLAVLAYRNNSTPSGFADGTIAGLGFSTPISQAKWTNDLAAWSAFQSALGR